MGIGQYDWADTVFQARMNSPATPSEPSIQNAMAAYRLNYPQARAVLSSLETAGFSLIQGYVEEPVDSRHSPFYQAAWNW